MLSASSSFPDAASSCQSTSCVPWHCLLSSSVLWCALQNCLLLLQCFADLRAARWISGAAVTPSSPPLVPPHVGSAVPWALLFGCHVSGDKALLWHWGWLRRHSLSGRSHSWGQAGCLVKSCFNSISERGWHVALWVGVQHRLSRMLPSNPPSVCAVAEGGVSAVLLCQHPCICWGVSLWLKIESALI